MKIKSSCVQCQEKAVEIVDGRIVLRSSFIDNNAYWDEGFRTHWQRQLGYLPVMAGASSAHIVHFAPLFSVSLDSRDVNGADGEQICHGIDGVAGQFVFDLGTARGGVEA
jgi:hypothetical protein